MSHRGMDEEDEDYEEARGSRKRRRPGFIDDNADEEGEDEATDVEQQALFPSVRDTKLWMVECAFGREREMAVCLMQKYIDKGSELQIRSAIALHRLKNYIYVEADKEAHVREACKGLRDIFAQKILLVPNREMTDVLSVKRKVMDMTRVTWVRMKTGIYIGDLAKVVDVDNVRQRVTVKLIPRIDLQDLANILEGREVVRMNGRVPRRLMNVDEARELDIPVEHRLDAYGEPFYVIGGMRFQDGFLYQKVSIKFIRILI